MAPHQEQDAVWSGSDKSPVQKTLQIQYRHLHLERQHLPATAQAQDSGSAPSSQQMKLSFISQGWEHTGLKA